MTKDTNVALREARDAILDHAYEHGTIVEGFDRLFDNYAAAVLAAQEPSAEAETVDRWIVDGGKHRLLTIANCRDVYLDGESITVSEVRVARPAPAAPVEAVMKVRFWHYESDNPTSDGHMTFSASPVDPGGFIRGRQEGETISLYATPTREARSVEAAQFEYAAGGVFACLVDGRNVEAVRAFAASSDIRDREAGSVPASYAELRRAAISMHAAMTYRAKEPEVAEAHLALGLAIQAIVCAPPATNTERAKLPRS